MMPTASTQLLTRMLLTVMLLSLFTEGRIKDVHERRPKLVFKFLCSTLSGYVLLDLHIVSTGHFLPQSTLNSASSVKKWIPSIKREIEYYLEVGELLLMHGVRRKLKGCCSSLVIERSVMCGFVLCSSAVPAVALSGEEDRRVPALHRSFRKRVQKFYHQTASS